MSGAKKQPPARAASPRSAREPRPKPTRDGDVDTFLRELDHPLKQEILQVRGIILGVSPGITEGIKWNSLSFRTTDDFATVHRRSTDALQLVFHFGAKAKKRRERARLSDSADLVTWLADDRCLDTLGTGKDIRKHAAALEAIVREWIAQM